MGTAFVIKNWDNLFIKSLSRADCFKLMYDINTLWNYPVEDLEDLRDLGGFFILYSIRSLQFIDLDDSILKK